MININNTDMLLFKILFFLMAEVHFVWLKTEISFTEKSRIRKISLSVIFSIEEKCLTYDYNSIKWVDFKHNRMKRKREFFKFQTANNKYQYV